MSLDKQALFEEIRSLWPEKIDLNGKVMGQKKIVGLQILNEIHKQKENEIDVNDHWHQLGIWAFHQAIWIKAEHAINAGKYQIESEMVTFTCFDEKMKKNLLGDDCWIVERNEYFHNC